MIKMAKAIVVSDEQRAMLENIVRSQTIDVRAASQARIVLLAGEGLGDSDIARQLDIGRIQAARWRGRKPRIGANRRSTSLLSVSRRSRQSRAAPVNSTSEGLLFKSLNDS